MMYPHLAFSEVITSSNHIDSDWLYSDLYRRHCKDEISGYLIFYATKNSWELSHNTREYTFSYTDQSMIGKMYNVAEQGDEINLSVPNRYLRISHQRQLRNNQLFGNLDLGRDYGAGIGFGHNSDWGEWVISLNANRQQAEIEHCIKGRYGTIPFAWVKTQLNSEFCRNNHASSLQLMAYMPSSDDSLFQNSLKLFGAEALYTFPISNLLRMKLASTYLHSSAELRYRGEQYGKLDIFNVLTAGGEIQIYKAKAMCRAGVNSYNSWINEDSYFDIWPFTAWDAFLAHRTRIKSLNVNSLLPYIGVAYDSAHERGLNYKADCTYNQYIGKDDILLKNRRVVLYPFIFAYEDFEVDLLDELDAYIEVNIGCSYRFGGVCLSLDLNQLAPINWIHIKESIFGSHSQSTGAKRIQEWGGSTVNFKVDICF
ncbi:MAG: hypothetical protein PHY41_06050 [Candidatus Cloacimonetes bacterium]|nr:hypothetical protein [Candidatus Cloacimonadota bacterium]